VDGRSQLALETLVEAVEQDHDKVDLNVLDQQLTNLLAQRRLVIFPDDAFDGEGRPDPEAALTGESVPLNGLPKGIVLTDPEAQARGWIAAPKPQQQQFRLQHGDQIKKVFNLLAGTALAQSKTEVTMLNIAAQLPDKGRFQLALGPTTVGGLVESRALFAALNNRLRFEGGSEVRLTIGEPEPDCKFVGLLKQLEG
jgi:hypothetical protein